jgi:transcriptional regulator with XRE-family HTH domain
VRKFSTKNRLRELREDNDISQTYLAKLLDMSQTRYSKYETGENDIPTNILIKLSKIYKTSIDYLLNQTDEKKPYKRKE